MLNPEMKTNQGRTKNSFLIYYFSMAKTKAFPVIFLLQENTRVLPEVRLDAV